MTTALDRQEAGTPRCIFDPLHEAYNFNVDVAASALNCKLPVYLTEEDNALGCGWQGERVWCNAPFDNIPPFLEHALEGMIAVYLLPVRSDRLWWAKFKPLAEVHYYIGQAPDKRIQFIPPPGIKYSGNAMCNCLFCFGEGFEPGRERYRSGRTGRLM